VGENRRAGKVSIGKPEGKRLIGIRRRGWEDNIKIDLGDIEWRGVDWIHLLRIWTNASSGQGNELSGSIKCWEFLEWPSSC
jgi:hypothetical protein